MDSLTAGQTDLIVELGIDMNKSVIALVITGSLALTGCSSSGSAGSSNGDNVVDRPQPQVPVIPDIDNSPEWGLDTGNTPDRPEPVDPDFGLPTPSIPDIDNTPDWGLDTGNTPDRVPPTWSGPDNSGNTPDRLPPVWGGPELPSIDTGPLTSYVINGDKITDVDGNEFTIIKHIGADNEFTVEDNNGNTFIVRLITTGEHAGNYYVFHNGGGFYIGGDTVNGGISPSIEGPSHNIDRNSVRDAIRARLNK